MAGQFKPCSVETCNGNAHLDGRGHRGFCYPHYRRWLRHGDPLGGAKRAQNGLPQTFLAEVVIPYRGSECLLWPFGRAGNGYARVGNKNAHRVVCEAVNGAPPSPWHQAAHSCGKGRLGCVAPSHLSWKTVAGNMADKIRHGTHVYGEKHGQAVLSADDVLAVRKLRGAVSQAEIGRIFGISRGAVQSILNGTNWAWLE